MWARDEGKVDWKISRVIHIIGAIIRGNGMRNNEEADRFFGFDLISSIGTHWMFPAFPEEEMSVNASTRILRNLDGLLAEVPLDGHSTIPHFLESPVRTPAYWFARKPGRFDRSHPDCRPDVKALHQTHPNDRDHPLGVNYGSMIGRVRDLSNVAEALEAADAKWSTLSETVGQPESA